MTPRSPGWPSPGGLSLLPGAQDLATAPPKPVLLPPRPRLSGASMFFMSCWRGWTPWNRNSSPCRGRRPTTTSTR